MQTSTAPQEGSVIYIGSTAPDVRTGRFVLTICGCCYHGCGFTKGGRFSAENVFWKHDDDASICYECWNADSKFVSPDWLPGDE